MRGTKKRRGGGISDGIVLGLLIGFFAGAVTVSLVAYGQEGPANLWAWADRLAQNLGAELFGAYLTFLLVVVLAGRRQAREAEELRIHERKQWLIRQMRSRVNEEAVQATEEMRVHGWLWDGSMHQAALFGANLSGADLSGANLYGANLRGANLLGADLAAASLVGTDLRHAQMQAASLVEADARQATLAGAGLEGAILREANLGEANLREANLTGADLRWARLGGADLSGANLEEAHLSRTNLLQANLAEANLAGARAITPEQLQMAQSLFAATLPDGTRLPADRNWRDAFEKWLEAAPVDEEGLVVPGTPGE